MEDYEIRNAREWDMNKRQRAAVPTASQADYRQNTALNRARPQVRPEIRSRNSTPTPGKIDDWRVVVDAKRREQREAASSKLVDLDEQDADPAETAWRNHQPPTEVIPIPDELFWQEPKHVAIACAHKTFVIAQKRVSEDGVVVLGIWGDVQAARHTKQDIHDWIVREKHTNRVPGLAKFHKSKSMLPRERNKVEKMWQREVVKQQYRRAPPFGAAFGAIGTFRWPVEEYSPEDVLGPSFEGLDRIRMTTACHIIFTPKIKSFQILGAQVGVREAALRLRNVCFQVAAREIATTRRYLLHREATPATVVLVPYEHVRPTEGGDVHVQESGQSPRGKGLIKPSSASPDDSRPSNALLTKVILAHQLSRLQYYRNHLDFRIRLGKFLVTQYRATVDGQYIMQDFESMLQQSQFRGEVTIELGDRTRENAALKALQSANTLLVPQHGMIPHLSDVKPVYNAIFTFDDRSGDLRHSITWHEPDSHDVASGADDLDMVSQSWTRFDRTAGTARPLVDISLLDLTDGSAWQFDLVGSRSVDRKTLPGDLADLARRIKIIPEAARRRHGDINFIQFNPYLPTKSVQQRISHRYNLTGSDYVLELTRFQDRTYTWLSGKPGQYKIITYEPRWSLEVYHSLWATHLAQNEHLEIGAGANWDAKTQTWFPEDELEAEEKTGDGVTQLLARLDAIKKLVLQSPLEMVVGMEVG